MTKSCGLTFLCLFELACEMEMTKIDLLNKLVLSMSHKTSSS